MRAEGIDAADAEVHLLALDLSDAAEAFRSECSPSAGDNKVMSVVLKQLDLSIVKQHNQFTLDFHL